MDGGGPALLGPAPCSAIAAAGQLWEVLPRTRSLAEVTSPAKVGPGARRDRLVVHHTSVPPDEIDERRGIPVTSVFRTIFDLAAVLSKRQLERALHEAEVRQLTDRLSLPDLLERHPGRRGAATCARCLQAGRRLGSLETISRSCSWSSSIATACRGRS